MKPSGKAPKASDGDGLHACPGARSKGIAWQLAFRFENRRKVLTSANIPPSARPRRAEDALRRGGRSPPVAPPGEVRKSEKQPAPHAEKEKALTFKVRSLPGRGLKNSVPPFRAPRPKKSAGTRASSSGTSGTGPFRAASRDMAEASHAGTGLHRRRAPPRADGQWRPPFPLGPWLHRTQHCRPHRPTLKPVFRRHRAASTDPANVGGLLRRIRVYAGAGLSGPYRITLLPSPPWRSEEIRRARRAEMDRENAAWTMPARRNEHAGMKLRAAHTAPHSRQVAGLLADLKKIQERNGGSGRRFPSPVQKNGPSAPKGFPATFSRAGT